MNFNGQAYAVDDATFKQFTQGYTQAQQKQTSPTSLKSLGLNPQDWLKDAKVDGDSSVGGTDTVKVTGSVDVPKLLTDVNTFLGKAGSLGIPNSSALPSSLTAAQTKQIEDDVKSSSVEIETGKDDSILRRIAFKLSFADPQGSGDIDFDISLSDLGESQSIDAPSNTKPLNDLLGSLGGLGALGGATGSSSGSGSSGASGASADAAQKYTDCVKKAGSDTSKLQDCSSLLTP